MIKLFLKADLSPYQVVQFLGSITAYDAIALHLICLDTGCGNGGNLTAMEMGTGEIWKARTMQ